MTLLMNNWTNIVTYNGGFRGFGLVTLHRGLQLELVSLNIMCSSSIQFRRVQLVSLRGLARHCTLLRAKFHHPTRKGNQTCSACWVQCFYCGQLLFWISFRLLARANASVCRMELSSILKATKCWKHLSACASSLSLSLSGLSLCTSLSISLIAKRPSLPSVVTISSSSSYF